MAQGALTTVAVSPSTSHWERLPLDDRLGAGGVIPARTTMSTDLGKPTDEHVMLMATCLCDAFFADMVRAAVEVPEHAGCEVLFPEDQTCCGQSSGLKV